jgi:O-antigen/teichoic acid export membrane protein
VVSDERHRLRWLTAGQVDAGFAALSGFAIGIASARWLEPSTLGAYALLFSAYGLVSQIPAQLIFIPSEVWAARQPVALRLSVFRWSIRRGLVFAAASGVAVVLGIAPLAGKLDFGRLTPMIASAIAFSTVSPIQDHVRKVLHLAERSWWAAGVSVFQLLVTIGAIFVARNLDALLVPFGAATVSNILSSGLGLMVVGRLSHAPVRPSIRELVADGRWLLGVAVTNNMGRFISYTVIGRLIGPAALGLVENARVVSRPADVIATGLLAVMRPRLMAASAAADDQRARRLRRTYFVVLGLVTGSFGLLVSLNWVGNPMVSLIPNAYVVPGLVAAVVISLTAGNLAAPYLSELVGARQMKPLVRTELLAQAVQITTSFTAGIWGSFSVPASHSAGSVVKFLLYRNRVRAHYDESGGNDAGRPVRPR